MNRLLRTLLLICTMLALLMPMTTKAQQPTEAASAATTAGAAGAADTIPVTGYHGYFTPVWSWDGKLLYTLRGPVVFGPDNEPYMAAPQSLFALTPDGRTRKPAHLANSVCTISADQKSMIIADTEAWTMTNDRPETLKLLWDPPSGHVLMEARFSNSSSGGFLMLTRDAASYWLWHLEKSGTVAKQEPLAAGLRYAWSPSGEHFLIERLDGLWWQVAGTSKPARLADYNFRSTVQTFAFVKDSPAKAYFYNVANDKYYYVWYEAGVLKVQEGPSGYNPGKDAIKPGPPATGQYLPSLLRIAPGAAVALAYDTTHLYAMTSTYSPPTLIGAFRPDGRIVWNGDGQMAFFSHNGEIYQYQQRTGKATSLTSGFDPAIAKRDNSQIAFWKMHGNHPSLFVRELDSGKQSLVATAGGKQPLWIGRDELAYLALEKGNWQIATANLRQDSHTVLSRFAFYTIQLASFPTMKEARLFADQCLPFSDGWPVYIISGEVNGVYWYRIRLGIFEDKDTAEGILAALKPKLDLIRTWDGHYYIATATNVYGALWYHEDSSALLFELMGTIYRADLKSGAVTPIWKPQLMAPAIARECALSPDGKHLAFVNEQHEMCLLNIGTGSVEVIGRIKQF